MNELKNKTNMNELKKKTLDPCIMDIKIGTVTVGEDASEEKRKAMEEKDKCKLFMFVFFWVHSCFFVFVFRF